MFTAAEVIGLEVIIMGTGGSIVVVVEDDELVLDVVSIAVVDVELITEEVVALVVVVGGCGRPEVVVEDAIHVPKSSSQNKGRQGSPEWTEQLPPLHVSGPLQKIPSSQESVLSV